MSLRHWVILCLLMAAEVVAGFESSMVLAALPSWLRIYGDPIGPGWTVSAYLLVASASAALCGRLGDLFGRKNMLMVVIGAACVGSIVSAAAPNLTWIIIGRAIQGLAGAIVPLCIGLAREHLPRDRVGFAIGFIIAMTAGATAAGFLLGGVLTDHLGPQSIFTASAIAAAIVIVIVSVGLPRSTPLKVSGPIDWLGGVLFAPAVAALLVVASYGVRWGWTSPAVLALGIGGVVTLAIWVWHELRVAEPLIDVRLLANRNTALANLTIACAAAGIIQSTQVASLILQQPAWTLVGLGTTATVAGLMKFPGMIAGIFASIWAGWVSDRRGGRLAMLVGCSMMAVAGLLGALEHGSVALILVFVVISQSGMAASYTGIPKVIVDGSPNSRTSEATGVMTVTRTMSQAIGSQMVAVLLATSVVVGPAGKSFPDDSAFTLVFWYMTALALLGIVFSSLVTQSERSAKATAPAAKAPAG